MNIKHHLIDSKQKLNKKWIVERCEEFWQDYQKSTFYSKQKDWERNDRYAEGQQDTNKYKKIVRTELDDGTSPVNINWDPLPFLTHYLSIYEGMTATERTVKATSIDPTSVDRKQNEKYQLQAMLQYREVYQAMGAKVPDISMEELDVFLEMNSREREEQAIETGAQYILETNNYFMVSKSIDRAFARYGVAGVKTSMDSQGYINVEFVNPKNAIVPDSQFNDYRDASYFGQKKKYTLGDIKKLGEFSDTELLDMARNYGSSGFQRNDLTATGSDGLPLWYDHSIDVIEFEFKTVDEKYYAEHEDKHGINRFNEKKHGYNGRKKKYIKRWTKWMKACWIPNSDIVFNYGYVLNMPTPNDNPFDCPSSFKFYNLNSVSLVERAIPIIDRIHIIWYKLQHLMSKARPDSVGVDIRSLVESVPNGKGGMFNPLDLIKLFTAGEPLMYKSIETDSGRSLASPITPIPGGMGTAFVELENAMSADQDRLRRVMGISEGLDATTPDNDQAVRNTYLAAEGTKTSMKNHRDAAKFIYQNLVEHIILLLQDRVRYGGDLRVYQYAISTETLAPLILTKGITTKQFGITIKEKPSPERVNEILQRASLLQAKRDQEGVGGINAEDFLRIERFLEAGATDLASHHLALAKKKALKEDREKQEFMTELNSKQQQDSARVSAEEQRKTIQLQSQIDQEARAMERDDFMFKETFKANLDLAKSIKEKEADKEKAITVEEIKAMAKLKSEEMKLRALKDRPQVNSN